PVSRGSAHQAESIHNEEGSEEKTDPDAERKAGGQAGGLGLGGSAPACHSLQQRTMLMDIAVAQQFLRENENAILATWRRDGRPQRARGTVAVVGGGRAIIRTLKPA